MAPSFRSPGFALSLVSTSTTGALHCAENVSQPGDVPEDVALLAARALLSEMATRGCVPRSHQPMVLLLMALGPEDVGKARLGRLTPQAVLTLRDVRAFTGVTFQVKSEREERVVHARRSEDDDDNDDDDSSASSARARAHHEDGNSETTQKQVLEETLVSCIGSAVRGARKVG